MIHPGSRSVEIATLDAALLRRISDACGGRRRGPTSTPIHTVVGARLRSSAVTLATNSASASACLPIRGKAARLECIQPQRDGMFWSVGFGQQGPNVRNRRERIFWIGRSIEELDFPPSHVQTLLFGIGRHANCWRNGAGRHRALRDGCPRRRGRAKQTERKQSMNRSHPRTLAGMARSPTLALTR